MNPRYRGLVDVNNGNQAVSRSGKPNNGPRFEISCPNENLVNGHMNQFAMIQECNQGKEDALSAMPFSESNNSSLFGDTEDGYQEACDFSNAILGYIDHFLMEEDMEDKAHMLQESLDFQAKEKSFYEVLGKKYPPSPQPKSRLIHQSGETPRYSSTSSNSDGSGYLIDVVDPSWINNRADVHNVNHSVWNFTKGIEEASTFLPSDSMLSGSFGINGSLVQDSQKVYVKEEKKSEAENTPTQLRFKKNRRYTDTEFEEEARSSKLPAVYTESDLPIEEFNNLLLYTLGEGEKDFAAYRDGLRDASTKSKHENVVEVRGSRGGRVRGKKNNKKKEVIDLRTLLINCAQAVAADDHRNATELLKQIRQHSSPFGDGNQRLSHYFADGLEARLAGTGSQIHKALVNKRTTAADFLKAYYTYLASSPFRKIFNFTSNRMILDKSAKEAKVHVIDFGILYGFQWPTFIQRISQREGGPPKLRITGIDFPQPGFRPAEIITETGRRLAHYAKTFNVPFDYNAIAQKWETIKVEDLKIEKDEFVVVTCLYYSKNLSDETVATESARTQVLNLIKKINPDIFIHGTINGAYSAPFFVTRFREVLFHFSALFDMLENNIPREKPERMLIERDIFGREALNVIACEGWERVERPETYKQWQVRTMRAGFRQIPIERDIMKRAMVKVRTLYHKDFVIDEDSQWLLLGWKGRIIYSISCWKPA